MADAAAEEQFGPYLVYERLGVGGMATVHRALERGGVDGFERVVALKRLLPHLAEDASFIKSFVREAKLASALSHVNIVQIYELGRVGPEYFISMEYIDGRDIRRILRHARRVTGPPPLHVTVGLLMQLCDALDYAHAKVDDDGHPMQLVHRDVSPSNLLVTTGGHLKVIDFGIAKAQSAQLRTQTGRVKGKLAYMAPEAIAGKELDARSDLFACGVIAHELLTARPLFASKNEYQTLLKVERGDILPPSTFNQACPAELDTIVLGALARDPDDRPATAGVLREQLQALRRSHKLQATPREIATWCEWAFSLEAPPSFGSSTIDQTAGSSDPVRRALAQRPRTPVPNTPSTPAGTPAATTAALREEEEAVDIAWGGGEQDGPAAPIELDDVPDVSEKHLASRGNIVVEDDDIPTPLPTHGKPLVSAAVLRQSGAHARLGTARSHAPTVLGDDVPGDTQPSLPPADADADTADAADGADADGDGVDVDLVTPPPPPSDRMAGLGGGRVPRTKPGVGAPARARSAPIRVEDLPVAPSDDDDDDAVDHDVADRSDRLPSDLPIALTAKMRVRPAISNVSIGASIAARRPSRVGWLLAAIVGLGGGAAAAWYAYGRAPKTATAPTPTAPAMRTTGTVKFVTEPADAQIRIGGADAHSGSPWVTELEPGEHPIEIHRDGYKAWLTSLELSAGETQTMRVVLEPLAGASTQAADATLILSSTPIGLEAVLDGTLLPQHTPIRVAIKVGPHSIALRDHGVEVWRQQLVAAASTNYEFSPSMDAAKQRERAERQAMPQLAPAPTRTGSPTPTPTPTPAPNPIDVMPAPIAPTAPAPPDAGFGAVMAPTPAPMPTIAPAAAATAKAGPVVVAPTAVTRIFGDAPSVRSAGATGLPPVATAKVCIDAAGTVTSATLLTKLDRHVATDLTDAIDGWRYAPYLDHGVATAACFVVSFRLK